MILFMTFQIINITFSAAVCSLSVFSTLLLSAEHIY